MATLGLGGFLHHDPSAVIIDRGVLVAAAEEERFTRIKHAPGSLPENAARFCIDAAGGPASVDSVAYSWSISAVTRNFAAYLWRGGRGPVRAMRDLVSLRRRGKKIRARVEELMRRLGLDPRRVEIVPVEHHLAHAASAYLFSGFEQAAVFSADGRGELTATLAGMGESGGIEILREWVLPDSLGMFYSSVTQYLGFPPNDGEYRTMGMAPYGDPRKAELGEFLRVTDDGYAVDGSSVGLAARVDGLPGRRLYSDRFVERFGPERTGDGLSEPYTHVAASAQALLERAALSAVEASLSGPISRCGNLCLAGGVAMNVVLNRALSRIQGVKQLFVPPAAGDAGCAAGAAAFVEAASGRRISPIRTSSLGPSWSRDLARAFLLSKAVAFEEPADPAFDCAQAISRGQIAGWFSGRMEFGPRALGNRSILSHPGLAGTADRINASVKFRERWRPFCPSVLASRSAEILEEPFDSPFMTYAFTVRPQWREKMRETVHVDGSSRAQIVHPDSAPAIHAIVEAFEKLTGIPAVLNTSLNRRGEPIAMSPSDALAVFEGSGLDVLYLEGLKISKPQQN